MQILYTQIDRDSDNRPHFTRHEYRVNSQDLFLSGQWQSSWRVPCWRWRSSINWALRAWIDIRPSRIDSAFSGQTAVREDPTAPGGLPTIAHYIRKLFAVSDNDAYNRLYEFVGQQRMNEGLWEKGVPGCAPDAPARHCALARGKPAYKSAGILPRRPRPLPAADAGQSAYVVRAPAPIPKGEGHVQNGALVAAPKGFRPGRTTCRWKCYKDLLVAVFFPEELPAKRRFDLRTRRLPLPLPRHVHGAPRVSPSPIRPGKVLRQLRKILPVRRQQGILCPTQCGSFNKVGLAYGYVTDNAYIVDFEHGVEFLLTAVVLVNENGIFNDGAYEYDEVGAAVFWPN